MVSGVSFKNPQAQRQSRIKKKTVSLGLLFMALLLGVVLLAYGIGVYLKNSAGTTAAVIEEEIQNINADIAQHTDSASRTVQTLAALDKELYTQHGADAVLDELERTIVPRVVLLSLEYAQNARAKESEIYSVSITGDVETFDALAAQIKSWKESALFYNVRAGGTTRDEDSGRLIFVVEMDVVPATDEQSVYAAVPPEVIEDTGEVVTDVTEEASGEIIEEPQSDEGESITQ